MSRNRRIYIGKLSTRTRERDIEDAFSKYGKINAVDLKRGYAFVVCVSPLCTNFIYSFMQQSLCLKLVDACLISNGNF
jgi:hypothetical protein